MDHQRRPRPDLLTLSSPARPVSSGLSHSHRQSTSPFPQSPYRFAHFQSELTEKSSPHADVPLSRVPSSSRQPLAPQRPPSRPQTPTTPSFQSRDQASWIRARLKPWLPIILYLITSAFFVVAIAFFKTSLFTFLDNLAVWLRTDEQFGATVLFVLIFITTFPPVPMYSTLIMLAGYTFGAWQGAIISYFAALVGAIVVFMISRTLLRETISRWLDSACTIKRVVRAVEKRPKLLFLVRLAPYPYNVLNALLAASPTLTFKTYTLCTAASLFKVIVHTSLGASIHSFKDYHSTEGSQEDDSANTMARVSTIVGVVLCVAIFIYLTLVVRRAVDEELGDDESADSEETAGFLANADEETGARPMVELRR